MGKSLKIAGVIVLLAIVFGAALYLDRAPEKNVPAPSTQAAIREEMQQRLPETTQATAAAETEAPAVTEAPAATEAFVEATVPETSEETTLPAETEPQQNRFLLSFVGDCTFGTNPANYYAEMGFVKTIGDDLEYPFRNVISYFEEDDATFINLEGPLTDKGNPVQKNYVFRGPESFVDILTLNSIEFATLANNHIDDYGKTGHDRTVAVLENAKIPFVERDSSSVFTLENGLTVGVYGTTYFGFDLKDMKKEIKSMQDQGVQLIIVAAHWGTEGGYKHIADQTKVGRAAIDAGAHIVWGSHPHVLQPIEEYNGGVIYYSLGNFSFGGNGAPRDFDSAIVQQEILLNTDGSVSLGERTIVPVSISSDEKINNFQPTPYEEGTRAYERVHEKLTGTYQGKNLT